jgi:Phage terminase, small subunit
MSKTPTRGDRWRLAVLDTFEYGPPELELLAVAAEALDRANVAQAAIDEHGVLIKGLHGPKVNPAIAVRRDAENMFLRYCALLGVVDRVPTDAPA